MIIEFDPAKDDWNVRERGLPFGAMERFDWTSAIIIEDKRRAYSEGRFVAHGFIGNRLHVACFTPIADGIRVISLRKANKREIRNYEKEIKTAHQ